MTSSVNTNKISSLIKWVIAIVIPLVLLNLQQTESYTDTISKFFAITVFAILLFAFELIDNFVVSLLLPVAYILCGVAEANVAWSPWASPTIWMVVAGALFSECLLASGIVKRLIYALMIKLGGRFNAILYGIACAAFIISLVQSGIPTLMMFAAITFGLCSVLNLGKSKASAAIMVTALFSCVNAMYIIYGPNTAIIYSVANEVVNVSVDFWSHLKATWIFIPFTFLMVFIVTKIMKPEKDIEALDYFVEQYGLLGKMSIQEKKSIIIAMILIVALMTQSIHKVNVGYIFIIGATLFYLPGVNIGNSECIRKIKFSPIIFMAACMSIGSVAKGVGVVQLFNTMVIPLLQGQSGITVLILIWVIAFVANFLLTPIAAISLLSGVIGQVAVSSGINTIGALTIFGQGLAQVILPYESSMALIVMSFGLVRMNDFIKIYAVKTVANLVYIFVIVIPLWKLMGWL